MRKANSLEVSLFGRQVGTLALADHCAAFQYDSSWVAEGFSISPLSLPLDLRVYVPEYRPFDGLFGIFSDSLPDGWGRLLVDRMLKRMGENPDSLSCLDRLSIIGESGMGALEYRPIVDIASRETFGGYDEIARECRKILNDEYSEDLDRLFHLGGSSGGARPKIMVDIDGASWIVKFHTAAEGPAAGQMEYRYMLCAKRCGIQVPEVRLLPSDECAGYFAIKRFDRLFAGTETTRVHMASAGALLETSHRLPNLDYMQLMKLTSIMVNDYAQLKELYRRMCFNVFAHNRDDHAKNFSFLRFDGGAWEISPAYDLTFSSSLGGEHATTIAGNGSDPGLADLLAVARTADIDQAWAEETAHAISEIVQEDLSQYLR